jgi:hypothetical protein
MKIRQEDTLLEVQALLPQSNKPQSISEQKTQIFQGFYGKEKENQNYE